MLNASITLRAVLLVNKTVTAKGLYWTNIYPCAQDICLHIKGSISLQNLHVYALCLQVYTLKKKKLSKHNSIYKQRKQI